jgi:5-methylcytosine-specific restriction protein B
MQGYRPKEEGEGFNLKNGVFYRFCKKASQDLTRSYVFIIDEINRGNLSKIFGEVMLLIESDKRGPEWGISLTYSNELSPKFHIPPNLFILGMMNTADRSLAMVDYALRRRFAFKDIEPGILTTQFSEYLQGMDVEASVVSKIQSKIGELNKKIEISNDLGAGFRIGHSFFVPNGRVSDSKVWYRSVIQNEIAPLLREYWFDKRKSEVDQEIEYLLTD